MAKGSAITRPVSDKGEVAFDANFDNGMMTVSVREKLAINKSTAEIPITDFIEIAAQVLLASVQAGRQMAAVIANQAKEPA